MRRSQIAAALVSCAVASCLLAAPARAVTATAGEQTSQEATVVAEGGASYDAAPSDGEKVADADAGEKDADAADDTNKAQVDDEKGDDSADADEDAKPTEKADAGTDASSTKADTDASANANSTANSDAAPTQTDAAAEPEAQADAAKTAALQVQAHVQNIGWQTPVASDQVAGTTGRALRMEALKVSLSGVQGTVQLQAHVADQGWDAGWSDTQAGTTGKSRALEAVRIRLTGDAAASYDIYYRVHAANVGWLGWAKNGDAAGTQGLGNAIEAVEVRLVPKGQSGPATGNAFKAKAATSVNVAAYVAGRGWQAGVNGGKQAGTTGQGRALLGVSMTVDDASWVAGSVQYRTSTSVSALGSWANAGTRVSSSTGTAPLQTIQVRLTGDMANSYDVYYRVHAANVGWMGWAKNGETAGCDAVANRAEAVQVVLVAKGGKAPGATSGAFQANTAARLQGQAHVSNQGWLDATQAKAGGDLTLGTTGRSLNLEALTCAVMGEGLDGSAVQIQAHVAELGWQDATTGIAGTTGRGLPVQAVKISLTGAAAQKYDIYYQVHVANIGWLGWAKNGEQAGTTGLARNAEAVRVRLVPKGQSGPTSSEPATLSAPNVTYSAHVQDVGWQADVSNGALAGTTGRALRMEAFKISAGQMGVSGSITYQAHVQDIGWQAAVKDGAVAGTIGQSKRVEAVKISLTGQLAKYYDVWYRVYVQDYGWMGWASNGAAAGTSKVSLRIEAIQVRIVAKGAGAPGSTANAYTEVAKGYQTPGSYPKLTYKQVTLPSYATGYWTYVHPYTLPSGASRSQCIETMIGVAYEYMAAGTPWVDNHCSRPGDQIDCSGLIMEGLYACGVSLDGVAGGDFNPYTKFYYNHHFANTWRTNNTFQPVSFAERERGDIIYWAGHVGIYLGNNQIIDAYPNQGVSIKSVYSRGEILGVARPFPKVG